MRKKTVSLAILTLFMVTTVSAVTIVDSRNWQDVYSAGLSEELNNGSDDMYFVKTSSAAGVFNVVPKQRVDIISSSDNSYTSNLALLLRSRDYKIGEQRRIVNGNTDLMPQGIQNYIVVQEDNPAAAVAVAPLAGVMDAWVLIANENNAQRISNTLENAGGETLMAGTFSNSVREEIGPVVDDKIIEANRFNLSVKIAERYLQETDRDVNSVRLSAGENLEESMFKSNMPVLLTGTNLLPDSVLKYVKENDVENAYVIGNQLTNVGEDLRNSTDDTSVFIKYGAGTGGQLYALNFYPLPNRNPNLEISYANFDPEKEKIYVKYRNTENSRLYALSSFSVTADGTQVASASDEETLFIGGEDSKVISYDVNLSVGELGDENIVSFTTSYGSSPNNLNTYVTNEGEFDPPYDTNLSVSRVNTNTNIEIEDVVYNKNKESFVVPVENTGEDDAYVNVDLRDIDVGGRTTSFSSDIIRIGSGSSKRISLESNLDEDSLEDLKEVRVIANYGSEEDNLVGRKERVSEIRITSGSEIVKVATSPVVIISLLILLIILIAAYINRKYSNME